MREFLNTELNFKVLGDHEIASTYLLVKMRKQNNSATEICASCIVFQEKLLHVPINWRCTGVSVLVVMALGCTAGELLVLATMTANTTTGLVWPMQHVLGGGYRERTQASTGN